MDGVMQKENEMGTMPVGKLVLKLSIPMIISVMITSLYSVVDSIYIGQISNQALTAISLAMPAETIMLGIAFGICIGVNALLSKKLGEKDYPTVSRIMGNGSFILIGCYLLFLLFGLFGAEWFLSIQTSDLDIQRLGTQYLSIIMTLSLGLLFQTLYDRLLSSTGKTTLSMFVLVTGALINIIVDPILIFGYFGFPAMGISGAALATVFAQTCAAIIGLVLNIRLNKDIQFHFKAFRFDKAITKDIIKIAVPASLTYAMNSVLTFVINLILIQFTVLAPAVYIIYTRVQSFIRMPVWGVRNTIVSIIAYNLGARKEERVQQTIQISIKASIVVMCFGMLLFEGVPQLLIGIFTQSSEMIEMGSVAFRIIGFSFIMQGVTVILGGAFQAMGYSQKTLVISIVQVASLALFASLLALTNQLSYVWLAFPIHEMIILVVSVAMYKQITRKHLVTVSA